MDSTAQQFLHPAAGDPVGIPVAHQQDVPVFSCHGGQFVEGAVADHHLRDGAAVMPAARAILPLPQKARHIRHGIIQPGSQDFVQPAVIIGTEEAEIGAVDAFVVAAQAVVVPHIDHFAVLIPIFPAPQIQSVILIEGLRRHIKGRGSAHEHVVVGEQITHLAIEGPAFFAIRIDGQLVLLHRLRSQQGEGQTSRRVIFHVVARIFREAVLLAQEGDLFLHRRRIGAELDIIPDQRQFLAFASGVLHAVIADDVHIQPGKLLVDPRAGTGAHDQNPVFFGKLPQNLPVFFIQRRLVLCQRAVQIKCKYLYHILTPLPAGSRRMSSTSPYRMESPFASALTSTRFYVTIILTLREKRNMWS